MLEDLVRYLRLSGLAQQSMEALAPALRRWVRLLREEGYHAIPNLCVQSQWTRREEHVGNLINMMVLQAVPQPTSRQVVLAHELRDLTRIR